MPDTFTSSCSVLPQISEATPKAIPKAMLPAAGTVVTDMKTPVSPPAFLEVSDQDSSRRRDDGDDEGPPVRGVDEGGGGPWPGHIAKGDPSQSPANAVQGRL